jgi:glycosyltransferase involved in cell wall biosynthesis
VKNNYFPLVSVIINCYNGEKFIERSIKSVLNQTYRNFEIIFFDNFSTDGTFSKLQSFKSKKIKYYKSKKFLKLYHARDIAIKHAKGELVSFLDVDDWWEHEKLKYQVKDFKKKSITISCTNYKIHNEINNTLKIAFKSIPRKIDTNILLKKNYIGLSTLMFRREDYDNLHSGFNHKYEIIGDYDFCLRLSKGRKILFLNRCLTNYRWHSNNLSNTKRKLNFDELRFWIYDNLDFKKFKNYSYLKNYTYFNLILSLILEGKKIKSLKYINHINFLDFLKVIVLYISPIRLLRIIKNI